MKINKKCRRVSIRYATFPVIIGNVVTNAQNYAISTNDSMLLFLLSIKIEIFDFCTLSADIADCDFCILHFSDVYDV